MQTGASRRDALPGTLESVAREVILKTGLRRSDAIRPERQQVKDEVATITLQKTERTSNVTVHIRRTAYENWLRQLPLRTAHLRMNPRPCSAG